MHRRWNAPARQASTERRLALVCEVGEPEEHLVPIQKIIPW
ncbi:MAG TPA: hypothetical protein VGF67_27990 [Ktedonobacteraceae bacterium]